MTEKETRKTNRLVTQAHEVDLSTATYSAHLSSASIDDETQSFHITIDKILYKHPVEIIEAVLHANGFALNLENILACIDDFKIGASVQLEPGVEEQSSTPVSFLHCVEFRLPQKSAAGPTLTKFYKEIADYESIIANINADPIKLKAYADREVQNQQKIADLEVKIREQTEINQHLQQCADSAIASSERANEALESANVLPPDVRFATVREVNIDERMVVLKSAQTTINLPLIKCTALPGPGDRCLVYVQHGNASECLFMDEPRQRLQPQLATVMLVKDNRCKIRDENRNTWLIEAMNTAELELFRNLKCNDSLLLYLLDNKPIRFEALLPPLIRSHVDYVQEAVSIYQIRRDNTNTDEQAVDTWDVSR